ncbi:MAG: hypothetical protein IIV52_01350 [Alistipes sp.]|nr:hypothetical protein [Alistipes sp.]
MKIFNYLSLLCVAALAFVACDNNDEPVVPAEKPVVELLGDVVEAEANGGSYSLNYTITNPVEEAMLSVVSDQEWVSDITVAAEAITFVVAPNEAADERTATLTLEYPEAEATTFVVKQQGTKPQPAESFTIEVQEVHASSAITQVTPTDEEMYYVMYLEEVSYFQNGGIATPEQLFEDDFAAFERNAVDNNMNLKEYMLQVNVAFQGVKRVKWNDVLPGVKSVLYVYGIQFNEDGSSYEPVTKVAWEVIEPEYAPLQDVNFDLDIEVDGAEVALNVKPENWDGYYVVKFVDGNDDLYIGDGATFDEEDMKSIADEWISVLNSNLRGGHTLDTILNEICCKGDAVVEAQLNSYTLYSALVFPVAEYDGFVQVVAEPSYINFSTEEVQQSDMDINIEVSNCYVRVADLKITPSNPDETYILLITPTEYLPADYDDEVLLDMALGEFIYYTYEFKGEVTTHLNTLYPNKEYIVVAFGYSGGVVTTDVCTKVFKTEPEGECELEITDVIIGGPYRPSDLYNYDPVRFKYYAQNYTPDTSIGVVTIEVKTSEPTDDIFACPFAVMDYDWAGHDTIFYDLLIDTCPPLELSDIVYDYSPYYVCAAAFDYKGNVTPMWMSEQMSWSANETKPIKELIQKLEADSSSVQLLAVPVRK